MVLISDILKLLLRFTGLKPQLKKRNIPRNRLIRDEVLVNIAVLKPREIDKLKKIRGISKNLSDEDVYQILETLKQSTKYNSDQWPQINNTYKKIDSLSNKFVLFCEYYNPKPISIDYRGFTNKLFNEEFLPMY